MYTNVLSMSLLLPLAERSPHFEHFNRSPESAFMFPAYALMALCGIAARWPLAPSVPTGFPFRRARLNLPLPGVPNPRPGRVVTGVKPQGGPPVPCSETSVATHDTSRSACDVAPWTKLHESSGAHGRSMATAGTAFPTGACMP